MYDKGKKVYFRDGEFKACFGTILEKVDENSALVTLRVRRDFDGKVFTITKSNPSTENVQRVEDNYRIYGHY